MMSQTHATRGVVGECRKVCHESVGGAFVRLAAAQIVCWRHSTHLTTIHVLAALPLELAVLSRSTRASP
eukprot:6781182-Prymnesium_polylepis.1